MNVRINKILKKNHANVDIVTIVLVCNLFKKNIYVSITYNDEINSLEDFF